MSENEENNNLPVATKWLLDAVGETGKGFVSNVFMIHCPKTGSKGSGFLFKDKYVITNWHVIANCSAQEIRALTGKGEWLDFVDIKFDENKDLAILTLEKPLKGGFEIDTNTEVKPGIKIATWGYPLSYNGPAPLLSIGYVSGFTDSRKHTSSQVIKHIVVNGAFNPGNSGGPVFIANSNKLIGVVVSKPDPTTKFLQSAITALENNKSGLIFSATDSNGTKISLAESQITAEFLKHFRKHAQYMIGEAIDKSELLSFLKEKKIIVD